MHIIFSCLIFFTSSVYNHLLPSSLQRIHFPQAPPAEVSRPWSKRIFGSQVLAANFTFDITFPHQNSLGLNLKPHFITASQFCGNNMHFGALVVFDVTSFLSQLVFPGDLLIRVNDVNLCGPSDSFDFDAATKSITNAKSPRVLRFFRPNGSPSNSLCSAELKLALTELQPRSI